MNFKYLKFYYYFLVKTEIKKKLHDNDYKKFQIY
jgi:hypothetical protein